MKSERMSTFVHQACIVAVLLLPCSSGATTISGNSAELIVNDPPPGVSAVKIATPDGVVFTSGDLMISADGTFPDGGYQYELIGELPTTGGTLTDAGSLENNGRSSAALLTPTGVLESGDFRIVDGVVVDTRVLTEE